MLTNEVVRVERSVSLADYTSPALLVPRLRHADAASAIQELSQALQREACLADLLPFYNAVLNREFLASSAMTCGIAVPHARVPGLKRAWFALGRTPDPFQWSSPPSAPVQLVFLVAVPSTEHTDYLYLLSGLARLGKAEEFQRQLLAAPDSPAMFELLQAIKLRRGQGLSV